MYFISIVYMILQENLFYNASINESNNPNKEMRLLHFRDCNVTVGGIYSIKIL